MDKQNIKEYKEGALKNVIGNLIQKKTGVSLQKPEYKEAINKVVEKGDIEELTKILKNANIDEQLIEEIQKKVPGLKETMDHIFQFYIDSFESLNDNIISIISRMNTQKIEQAKNNFDVFVKRVRTNDIAEIKVLRNKVECDATNLLSELKSDVAECESLSKKKKMIFGWLKVEAIKKTLVRLENTLDAYMQTVELLSRIEIYLSDLEGARDTLNKSCKEILDLFHYREPTKNRMFTLTDEDKWISVPQIYCDNIKQILNNLDKIEPERLLK